MIRAVLIIVALMTAVFLLRVLLVGSAPRHSGLSRDDLSRYAGYLSRALSDRGRVEVGSPLLAGTLVLEKRVSHGSPPGLVIRLRRASFGRRWLARVADLLAEAGIPHTVERSRRLRVLTEIGVPIDTSSPRVINSGATTVSDVLETMGVPGGARLTVTCRGPFRPGFQPEDGEVLPHPLSHRIGVGIGRTLGAISHLLRGREGR